MVRVVKRDGKWTAPKGAPDWLQKQIDGANGHDRSKPKPAEPREPYGNGQPINGSGR